MIDKLDILTLDQTRRGLEALNKVGRPITDRDGLVLVADDRKGFGWADHTGRIIGEWDGYGASLAVMVALEDAAPHRGLRVEVGQDDDGVVRYELWQGRASSLDLIGRYDTSPARAMAIADWLLNEAGAGNG